MSALRAKGCALVRLRTWNVAHCSPTVLQFGAHVTVPDVVPSQRRLPLGWETGYAPALLEQEHLPHLQIRIVPERGRPCGRTLPLTALRRINVALVDPLIDEHRMIAEISELDRKNFARPHPIENGHSKNQPLPQFEYRQRPPDFVWRS